MAHSCVFTISSSSETGAWLIVVSHHLTSSEAHGSLCLHHLIILGWCMAHSCVFTISSSSEAGAWLIVVSSPSHHLLRLVHGS